jgi:hypothetical protein
MKDEKCQMTRAGDVTESIEVLQTSCEGLSPSQSTKSLVFVLSSLPLFHSQKLVQAKDIKVQSPKTKALLFGDVAQLDNRASVL